MTSTVGGRRLAPKQLAMLLAAAAVSSAGTGVFLATATIFFVRSVGLTGAQVGVAASAGAVVGLLLTPVTGRLADRHRVVTVLVLVLAVRAVAYGSLAAADGFALYFAAVVVGLSGDQVTPPLQQAIVGQWVTGRDRPRTLGTLRAVRNIGLSAGLAVGGVLLLAGSELPVRAALLVNGLSYLVLAAAYRRISRDLGVDDAPLATPERPQRVPYRPLLALAAGNGALLFHDTLLFVLLPLWVAGNTALPPVTVAVAMLINTGLTVVLQLWLPRGQFGDGWRRGIVTAAVVMAVAGVTFAVADRLPAGAAFAMACAAVLLLTVGENLHAVSSWNLSYAVSPPDRMGEYLSVFSLGGALQGIVGPLLATLVVLPLLPGGWLVTPLLFGLGCLVVFVVAPRLEARVAPAESTEV